MNVFGICDEKSVWVFLRRPRRPGYFFFDLLFFSSIMSQPIDKAFDKLQPLFRQLKVAYNCGKDVDNPNVLIFGNYPKVVIPTAVQDVSPVLMDISPTPLDVVPMVEPVGVPPPDDFEGPSFEMSSPDLAESPVMPGLSSPKAKSTIIQPSPTIELPSQIGALCASSPFPPGSSHQPFIDHSLSSVMSENSISKKRRIFNEDENDKIWKADDDLNENHDDNKEKGKSRNLLFSRQQNQQQQPFTRTITVDELTIVNETQREQLRLIKLEFEYYKETNVRQLMLLEKQNKKYENEIDEKTNKYYEDKKKWQLKIKEIEEKYQRLSSLSSFSATTSSSPAKNSDHFSQYISDLRNQLSSVTDMLIDTLAENEQLLQNKISFEKKNIWLENETKSLQPYLQSYQSSSPSAVSSSSSSSSQQEKNDS
jgi:hypothetical protein